MNVSVCLFKRSHTQCLEKPC